MECLPETGLSSGTTVAIVAIALALIAVSIVLIIKSRRGRAGALMAIGLVGLLGAMPLASAPNAAAGVDCNGQNAVYVTETSTATETAPGSTETSTVTETAPGATVTETAPGTTETAAGATVTETAEGATATVTETAPGVTTTATETAAGPTTTVTTTVTAARECAAPPAWLTAESSPNGSLYSVSYGLSADDNSVTNAGGEEAFEQIREILTRGTLGGTALCDLKISWVQSIVDPRDPDDIRGRTLTFTGWNDSRDAGLFIGFDADQQFEVSKVMRSTITGQLSFTRTDGSTGNSEITFYGDFNYPPT